MTTVRQQLVTFRLGDDLFAADIYSVERVLRYQPPTPIPNVPEWVDGVIEYRGRIIPVIDLRLRFGLERTPPRPESRILVFTVGNEWIGAIVDAVLEVSSPTSDQLSPPPPLFRGLSAEFLRGVVRRNDRLVVFLEVTRLLTTDERLVLERVTEEAAPNA
ncbi:MAG TPA: chemotaxis protein CheW [Gemmatimonadaceae bacterium]|nr:chemotaxis protein CheW [Gemmatimonadaceae bacterium]